MQALIPFVGVFLCGLVLDYTYCKWAQATTAREPLGAAIFSVVIGASGVMGVTAIVNHKALVLPYLLGLFCGTLLGSWGGDLAGEDR